MLIWSWSRSKLAGGDCTDDADLLRCGQTAAVLGNRVMAPSTGWPWAAWFALALARLRCVAHAT